MGLASLRAPGSLEFCGAVVELDYAGSGIYAYERRGPRRGDEARLLLDSGEATLVPVMPVYYPEHVTDYIMVKLPEPLALAAGRSARLVVSVEYDVAVTVGGHVVDVFPSRSTAKYAVYGRPPRGLLVRYLRAAVGEAREACGGCCGELRLEVENASESNVTIRRIVFPAVGGLRIEEGIVKYPPVKATIVGASSAIVVVAWQRRGRGASRSFVMGYGF